MRPDLQSLCFNSVPFTAKKQGFHVPSRKDAFPPLDAFSYPFALLVVPSTCIDRVQGQRLGFTPVGYETHFIEYMAPPVVHDG